MDYLNQEYVCKCNNRSFKILVYGIECCKCSRVYTYKEDLFSKDLNLTAEGFKYKLSLEEN